MKYTGTLLPKDTDTAKATLDLLDKLNREAQVSEGQQGEIDAAKASIADIEATTTPIGSVTMYAGATVPTKWLLCDGQAVSRTTYATLFARLGTTWGVGDGSTTFNLPDMRGAAPAGVGTSTGYTQNETLVLGTKYNDQIQGHRHDIAIGYPFGRNGTVTDTSTNGPDGATARTSFPISGDPRTDGTNGTPRTGNVTRGKRVGLNFIIKAL